MAYAMLPKLEARFEQMQRRVNAELTDEHLWNLMFNLTDDEWKADQAVADNVKRRTPLGRE